MFNYAASQEEVNFKQFKASTEFNNFYAAIRKIQESAFLERFSVLVKIFSGADELIHLWKLIDTLEYHE